MIVTVRTVIYRAGETVAIGIGTVTEGPDAGKAVEFAGDWRPMLDLREALEDGEQVVDIEDWQILGGAR